MLKVDTYISIISHITSIFDDATHTLESVFNHYNLSSTELTILEALKGRIVSNVFSPSQKIIDDFEVIYDTIRGFSSDVLLRDKVLSIESNLPILKSLIEQHYFEIDYVRKISYLFDDTFTDTVDRNPFLSKFAQLNPAGTALQGVQQLISSMDIPKNPSLKKKIDAIQEILSEYEYSQSQPHNVLKQ